VPGNSLLEGVSFQALDLLMIELDDLWREIKQEVKKTTEAHVPVLGKRHKSPWISEAAIEIANQRRKEKTQGKCHSLVKKLNGDFQRQIRKNKEKYIGSICSQME